MHTLRWHFDNRAQHLSASLYLYACITIHLCVNPHAFLKNLWIFLSINLCLFPWVSRFWSNVTSVVKPWKKYESHTRCNGPGLTSWHFDSERALHLSSEPPLPSHSWRVCIILSQLKGALAVFGEWPSQISLGRQGSKPLVLLQCSCYFSSHLDKIKLWYAC